MAPEHQSEMCECMRYCTVSIRTHSSPYKDKMRSKRVLSRPCRDFTGDVRQEGRTSQCSAGKSNRNHTHHLCVFVCVCARARARVSLAVQPQELLACFLDHTTRLYSEADLGLEALQRSIRARLACLLDHATTRSTCPSRGDRTGPMPTRLAAGMSILYLSTRDCASCDIIGGASWQ